MFGDYLVSQIRTYVPSGVGALISWLAFRGVEVDTDTQLLLVTGGTAAATAGYYTIASAIQKKWPIAGRYLLGSKKAPSYSPNSLGGGAGDKAASNDPTGASQ
jgi:hypothetical protein